MRYSDDLKADRSDLTAEYVRSRLDYDPETCIFRWKWCEDRTPSLNAKYTGKIAGTRQKNGHMRICIGSGNILDYQLAALYLTDEWLSRGVKTKEDLTAEYLRTRLDYDPAPPGIFRWKPLIGSWNTFNPDSWNAKFAGQIAGTDKAGYVSILIDGTAYLAHRLAWLYMTGELPIGAIDHIDRDPSNNAFDNLRQASHSQNRQNTNLYRSNSTGCKGVSWHEDRQKYRVRIQVNNKSFDLGHFDSMEEADAAYRAASLKYHGEFSIYQ